MREAGSFAAVKKTLLAAALLVTSVFSVTGCGSDDDVDVESRVKNAAPEATAVSDFPSESDCDLLDRLAYDYLLDRYDDIIDSDRRDVSDFRHFVESLDDDDLREPLDLLDLLDLLDRLDLDYLRDLLDDLDDLRYQCDVASKSGYVIDDLDSGTAIDDDDNDNTPPPSCMYVGDKYECYMDPPESADVEIGKPFAHLDDVDDDGDVTPSPSYIFLGDDIEDNKMYAPASGDDVDGG
jgi:hypothetical protein